MGHPVGTKREGDKNIYEMVGGRVRRRRKYALHTHTHTHTRKNCGRRCSFHRWKEEMGRAFQMRIFEGGKKSLIIVSERAGGPHCVSGSEMQEFA